MISTSVSACGLQRHSNIGTESSNEVVKSPGLHNKCLKSMIKNNNNADFQGIKHHQAAIRFHSLLPFQKLDNSPSPDYSSLQQSDVPRDVLLVVDSYSYILMDLTIYTVSDRQAKLLHCEINQSGSLL